MVGQEQACCYWARRHPAALPSHLRPERAVDHLRTLLMGLPPFAKLEAGVCLARSIIEQSKKEARPAKTALDRGRAS
jgi:hypothetical protein